MKGFPHPADFASEIGRKILQLNGADMYGVFNDSPNLVVGDEVEVEFSNVALEILAQFFTMSGPGGIGGIYADGTNAINYNAADYSAATLNGVAITRAVTSWPQDGGVHKIKVTVDQGFTITHLGSLLGSLFFWHGSLLSISFIDNSGAEPVIEKYTLNSGSNTIEYADGHAAPSTKYIVYHGVSADSADWPAYCWGEGGSGWKWLGGLDSASALVELVGTATTPTSFSITTVTGTTIQLNPEGLIIQTGLTYTFAAAPVGESIWLVFEVIDVLTEFNLSNMGLTAGSMDNVLCVIASSIGRVPRSVTVTLTGNTAPSAKGLACKETIEDASGVVSVDP